jgi:hypothetical protein
MKQHTSTAIQDKGLTASADRNSGDDGGEILQIDHNTHHTYDEAFVIADRGIEEQCRTPTPGIAGNPPHLSALHECAM